jgi:arylformamidase
MVPRGFVEFFDITLPIRPGMLVYPGDPPVRLERVASIEDGAQANVSMLALSVHAGTHVDAPAHYLDGAGTVDALPLGALIGPAHVVDLTDAAASIDHDAVARLSPGATRPLLRTRRRAELTEAAARELVGLGVRLVGIDQLTVGGDEVHRILLAAGVVILESLDLRGVEAGTYTLVCLPLKLEGSDGSPARAVLLQP